MRGFSIRYPYLPEMWLLQFLFLILSMTVHLLEGADPDPTLQHIQRLRMRYADCRLHDPADDDPFPIWSKQLLATLKSNTSPDSFGVVGILGGAGDHSGASTFAALAALRAGASRVDIFCDRNDEAILKSIHEGIRVIGIVDTDWGRMYNMISAADIVLIGPGLEETQHHINVIYELLPRLKALNKPLIFHLTEYFITQQFVDNIPRYPLPGLTIITNVPEFEKLYSLIRIQTGPNDQISIDFDKFGPNLFIMRRGCTDSGMAPNVASSWASSIPGSPLAKEGMDSILSGATAFFIHRALKDIPLDTRNTYGPMFPLSLGSYAGSLLLRNTSRIVYQSRFRSGLASDMIEYVATYVYQINKTIT